MPVPPSYTLGFDCLTRGRGYKISIYPVAIHPLVIAVSSCLVELHPQSTNSCACLKEGRSGGGEEGGRLCHTSPRLKCKQHTLKVTQTANH